MEEGSLAEDPADSVDTRGKTHITNWGNYSIQFHRSNITLTLELY